jgi:hypothetical protein
MKFRFACAVLLALLSLPAFAADKPSIQVDSVRIEARPSHAPIPGKPGFESSGWAPLIEFRVNGPVPSGSQLSVEYTVAGAPFFKRECPTEEVEAEKSLKVECWPGDRFAGTKTGMVDFTVKLRNELEGTNAALYSGKFKIGTEPPVKGADPVYYVDDDWRLPFGYVYYGGEEARNRYLCTGFHYRGNPPDMEAHLYYNGKDIAKWTQAGNDAGEYKPAKYQWGYAAACFKGVYQKSPGEEDAYPPNFSVAEKPGDYEVRVLIVHHLARRIKFTVAPDGSFADPLGSKPKLASGRVAVPVEIIGTAEPWDKVAWKTGAFYGHPLAGFAPASAAGQ